MNNRLFYNFKIIISMLFGLLCICIFSVLTGQFDITAEASTIVTTVEVPFFNKEEALSNMTEEECLDFVREQGIEIPYGYDNDLKFGAFTLDIIKAVEANPDVEFGFNFIDILTYANNVRNYVNDYYSVSQYSRGMVGVSKAAYILQDNLVKNSNGDIVQICKV